MRLIEITANELGGHDNMNIITGDAPELSGWAIIPDDMEIPSTFPFVGLTVKDGIVTEMQEGVMPPAPEPVSEPESETDIWAEMADAITSGVNSID